MPPLRGVIHAAGSLADTTIDQLDADRFRHALAPKLAGAFRLHEATVHDPLDHFVTFSSVAAVLGLAGQANYAAGNAFLDALAHQRRKAGRPALSIDWGPWSTIGLAAGAGRGDRLAERGLGGLAPDDALDVFDRLLDGDRTQVLAMHLDAERWCAAEPAAGHLLELLTRSADVPAPATQGLRDRIAAARPGARRHAVVEDAVCAELAPVLRLNADRIDRHVELKAMGLDSLMALELRNRLEVQTGQRLPATVVWNHPTVVALATYLAERMGVALDATADEPGEVAPPPPRDAPPEHGETSDELEALMAEELAAVDRLLDAGGRAP
jgi:acyl carrier protein